MPKDASIYPRKRSPYYWLSYWCPAQLRRKHVSTMIRRDDPNGYRKALRMAQDKSEEATATRGVARREAWGSWVEAFIRMNYPEREDRPEGNRTLERYLGAWDVWREFLAIHKVATPAAFDYNTCLDFVKWRKNQKRNNGKLISHNTALCDLRVMSVIMREAVRRGFCQGNPCDRIGLKRSPTKQRPELTREEIEIVRAGVDKLEGHLPWSKRWMTVSFEFALHQSIRLRATSMPLDNIDLESRQITWETKSHNGERKFVTKRLHGNLVPIVKALIAEGATHTCVMPKMAAKLWWEFRKENGLEHTTFHSTRVTVVTELARKGVSEQMAMAYVEHSSRIVHGIYQRLKAPDLAAAEAALDFSPRKVRRWRPVPAAASA